MKLKFEKRIMCPVCQTEREIPRLQSPRPLLFFSSLAIAASVAVIATLFLTVQASLWTGLLVGVLFFLGVEVYYSAKFRRELECPVCQFDPLLYRRKPEEAKERCLKGLKIREELFLARWRALKDQTRPRDETY